MRTFAFRLKPGEDLLNSIQDIVERNKMQAGCVLSGVGSLTHATLRLADREDHNEYDGHFEIVSVTGTVSVNGSHIHLSFSDADGETIGGHLVPGCRIYTTAEIVLAALEDVVFERKLLQNDSGYQELVVRPSKTG